MSSSYIRKRQKLQNGETTCLEEVINLLKQIDEKSELNAYLTINPNIEEQARESDSYFRAKKPRALEGMTIAVKDNINVEGLICSCGSKMLEDYASPYDATAIERIKAAGGIIVGKTNLDEFAMGSSGETSYYGAAKNPIDEQLSPGGSSSGSAAAAAADLADAALGSDTGGSIRQPAAFCGIYGLKPTYGAVSRYGLVAHASSFDQIGVLSKNLDDLTLLYDTISGYDPKDANSTSVPKIKSDTKNVENFTIAYPDESVLNECDKEVYETFKKTIDELEKIGIRTEQVTHKHSSAWLPAYYILSTAEASSNLARYDGIRYGHKSSAEECESVAATRTEGFGAETKRRIVLGSFALSEGYKEQYYAKALKARRLIKGEFDGILEEYDFYLSPTSPTPPFKLNEKKDKPIEMYKSDYFTVPASLTGLPALSAPIKYTSADIPFGLQIISKEYNEDGIIDCAGILKKRLNYRL